MNKAFEDQTTELKKETSEPSKWAKLSQTIQDAPVYLEDYTQQLKKDMRDFRDNFEFHNDE